MFLELDLSFLLALAGLPLCQVFLEFRRALSKSELEALLLVEGVVLVVVAL